MDQIDSCWLLGVFLPDYLQGCKCISSVQMHTIKVICTYNSHMNIPTTGVIWRFGPTVLEVIKRNCMQNHCFVQVPGNLSPGRSCEIVNCKCNLSAWPGAASSCWEGADKERYCGSLANTQKHFPLWLK